MPKVAIEAHCTFCTKPAHEIAKLIAGPGIYICNECVALCNDILALPTSGPSATMDPDALSDEEILGMLPGIATVATQIEDGLHDWVQRLRDRGVSWARIGSALGMARQSAWERFSGEE